MINDLVQEITIPPAPPTGLYDADFQAKVVNLLAYFNTHAVELTTLIEKMNIFKTEVNGAIPLFYDGMPVGDYIGDTAKTFLVKDAALDDEAVNLRQLRTKSNEVGEFKISSHNTLEAGWEIWQEETIVGALVEDYQDLIASGSFLVANNNGTTFDLRGHHGRYFRPAGTTIQNGELLGDTFESHSHSGARNVSSVAVERNAGNPVTINNPISTTDTGLTGGTETRPKTIGVYMKIYVGEN